MSSSLPHSNRSPSSLHRRHRYLRLPPKPLLSDICRDLTSSSNNFSSSFSLSDFTTRRLLKYYARLASKIVGSGHLREFLMLSKSVLTSEAIADDAPQFASQLSHRLVSEGISSVLRWGICSIVYCFFFAICRHKKVHNLVQPTIAGSVGNGAPNGGILSSFASPLRSKSRIFIRLGSRIMRRQRSGPLSLIRDHRAEEFTFAKLATTTKDLIAETKISAGSFSAVYKGKLPDGREVAIKRSESGPKTKNFQEKKSAFQSELEFLSRLHHKHLVGLLGYCEEDEERLLVHEFIKPVPSTTTSTPKRAIFKGEGEGENLVSVVDYALPSITGWEVRRVMDARAETLGEREAEAVELVAYTTVHCVSLERRERSAMSDVVANLETVLALCDDSRGSQDSGITNLIDSPS